ncbi:MAG: VIT1/CCC1 transporter family protein [Actinomycetota bacterium]
MAGEGDRSGAAASEVHHGHRSVTGGEARAAVFGASDGLVSNVSLILGVAGADVGADIVRVTGLAGLVAGAVSMAAGEWVSMQAQRELLERELARERRELERNPKGEAAELAALYRSRGLDAESAQAVADAIAADVDVALDVHAREELGVDPDSLGSPFGAAASSFGAFAVGAVIPLAPWFFASGTAAIVASMVLAVLAAAVLGGLLAVYTARSIIRSALRQVLIAAGAAGITFLIGAAVGVNVT